MLTPLKYEYYFDREILKEGFYIYSLMTPDRDIFYIGKGKGRRCFEHFFSSSLKKTNRKSNKIKNILASGKKVIIDVLVKGITEESEALSLEESIISSYGIKREGGQLYNEVKYAQGFRDYVNSKSSWDTKLAKYSREEISAWTSESITEEEKERRAEACKKMWENRTEQEKEELKLPLYKNPYIPDYTCYLLADVIYLIWKKLPEAQPRFYQKILNQDTRWSLDSILKAFKEKSWVPSEDEDYLSFLKEKGRKTPAATQICLSPFARDLSKCGKVLDKSLVLIDETGKHFFGNTEIRTKLNLSLKAFYKKREELERTKLIKFKDLVDYQTDNIPYIKFKDGSEGSLYELLESINTDSENT